MSNNDTAVLELAVKLRSATLRAKLARNGLVETAEMRKFSREIFSNYDESDLIAESVRVRSPIAMFLYGGKSTLIWRFIYIGVQLDFLGNVLSRYKPDDSDIFSVSGD